jgi:hypothetical protein
MVFVSLRESIFDTNILFAHSSLALVDTRPAAPDSWTFRTRNQLLFPPDLETSRAICNVRRAMYEHWRICMIIVDGWWPFINLDFVCDLLYLDFCMEDILRRFLCVCMHGPQCSCHASTKDRMFPVHVMHWFGSQHKKKVFDLNVQIAVSNMFAFYDRTMYYCISEVCCSVQEISSWSFYWWPELPQWKLNNSFPTTIPRFGFVS